MAKKELKEQLESYEGYASINKNEKKMSERVAEAERFLKEIEK